MPVVGINRDATPTAMRHFERTESRVRDARRRGPEGRCSISGARGVSSGGTGRGGRHMMLSNGIDRAGRADLPQIWHQLGVHASPSASGSPPPTSA
jgi:hypothetical protein